MTDRSTRRVLLFGGGGVHDFRAICPVLEGYLAQLSAVTVDYVIEDCSAFHADRIQAYDLAVLYHTGGELQTEPKRNVTS